MKWLCLISVVAIPAWTCSVSADEGTAWGYGQSYYTSQEDVAPELTPEVQPVLPEAMVYEDFPAWSRDMSSYRGLGYTGVCCEQPPVCAQMLWSDYCAGQGGCGHGGWFSGLLHHGKSCCRTGSGCGTCGGCCAPKAACCSPKGRTPHMPAKVWPSKQPCSTVKGSHSLKSKWFSGLKSHHSKGKGKGKGSYDEFQGSWNSADPAPAPAEANGTPAMPLPPTPAVDQPTDYNQLPGLPDSNRSANQMNWPMSPSFPRGY